MFLLCSWKNEIWSNFMRNWWSLHTCQDISSNSISTILLDFALPVLFMLYFKWKFTEGSAVRVHNNLFKCYIFKLKHSSCKFAFIKEQAECNQDLNQNRKQLLRGVHTCGSQVNTQVSENEVVRCKVDSLLWLVGGDERFMWLNGEVIKGIIQAVCPIE